MTEFSRITTRGGDSGETGIADGTRLPKNDALVDTLGEVDELQAALGLFKAALAEPEERGKVDDLQRCLIRMGGMLAIPAAHSSWEKLDLIDDADLDRLEALQEDVMDRVTMPPLFITYGGSEAGARCDLARAVCRRAERRLAGLIRERGMDHLAPALRFLNRLSDYLFVRARELDAAEGDN